MEFTSNSVEDGSINEDVGTGHDLLDSHVVHELHYNPLDYISVVLEDDGETKTNNSTEDNGTSSLADDLPDPLSVGSADEGSLHDTRRVQRRVYRNKALEKRKDSLR